MITYYYIACIEANGEAHFIKSWAAYKDKLGYDFQIEISKDPREAHPTDNLSLANRICKNVNKLGVAIFCGEEFRQMSTGYTWEVRLTKSRWEDKQRWYIDGPGQPGYYGATMQSEMYFDTKEEAERSIPMIKQAYLAGRREKEEEIKKVLGIK